MASSGRRRKQNNSHLYLFATALTAVPAPSVLFVPSYRKWYLRTIHASGLLFVSCNASGTNVP